MIQLKVFRGNEIVDELELRNNEELSIGRSSQNRLVLHDHRISRKHCLIYYVSSQWKVKDLQSTQGTMVNGTKIAETAIRTGDIIQLFDYKLEVCISEQRREGVEAEKPLSVTGGTVFMPRQTENTGKNRIEILNGDIKGQIRPLLDSMLIGRQSTCDLVLPDKSISREHALIFRSGNKYKIKNLSDKNATFLNGSLVKRPTVIKSQNIIKIGTTTLKVLVDDHTNNSSSLLSRFQNLNKWGKTAFLLVPVFMIILLCFVAVKSPEKKSGGVSISNPKPESPGDTKTQRDIFLFLKIGKDLFEKQNYAEALTRFQAVLTIQPQHAEALKYTQLCKARIDEQERIRREQEEKEKNLQNKLKTLLARANEHLQQGQINEARAVLNEAKAIDDSNKDVNNLLQNLEAEAKAIQDKLGEEARKKELLFQEVKTHFSKGQKHYQKGEFSPAMAEFNAIIALNVACKETTEARALSEKVKDMLKQKVKTDYTSGMEYYNAREFSKALPYLQEVVEVYPDYENIKQIVSEIERELEPEAKRLYQEGVVYEGIGNMDAAIKKWNEVLKKIPISSNEYYQKAYNKLNRGQ